MPNWCLNCVNISHADKAMMDRLGDAVNENGKGLFMEFFPTPKKLTEMTAPITGDDAKANIAEFGASDWYHWNVENWGTKWDATVTDFDRLTENEAFLTFDTAWGPPVTFYEKMTALGFKIDALYSETDMCFAGTWNEESGDNCYEYDFSDPNWDDGMPDEVKDFLECEYENYLMWQEEEMASNTAH